MNHLFYIDSKNKTQAYFWEATIVFLACILGHHPAIYGTYHQDDQALIERAADFRQTWLFGHRLMVEKTINLNRFLSDSALSLHIFNLFGHGLGSISLYLLCRQFINTYFWNLYRSSNRGHLKFLNRIWTNPRSRLPFYTALFFAIHPLTTEASSYITARSNCWGGAFALFGFAAFLKALNSRVGSKWKSFYRVILFILSMGIMWLSFEFKETHLILILLLPFLFIYKPFRFWNFYSGEVVEKKQTTNVFRYLIIRIALIAMLTICLALLYINFKPSIKPLVVMYWDDPLNRLASNTVIVSWNWLRMIWPYKVSLEYVLPFCTMLDPLTWVAIGFNAMVILSCYYLAQSRPMLFFYIILAYISILPTNSILSRWDQWSDRNGYLFFGSTAVVIIGILFEKIHFYYNKFALRTYKNYIYMNPGKIMLFGLLLWFVAMMFKTRQRTSLYRDPVAFWEDTVRSAPLHPRANLQLAYIYDALGRKVEAKQKFQKTVDLCNAEAGFKHAAQYIWLEWALERLTQMSLVDGTIYNTLDELEEEYLLDSENPAIAKNLLKIYLALGMKDQAKDFILDAEEFGIVFSTNEKRAVGLVQ